MRSNWETSLDKIENLMNLHYYIRGCIDTRDLADFEETLSELEEINEMKTALIISKNVNLFWKESAPAIEKLLEKFNHEKAKCLKKDSEGQDQSLAEGTS